MICSSVYFKVSLPLNYQSEALYLLEFWLTDAPALAGFPEAHKSVEVVILSASHPPSPEALSSSPLHSHTFPTKPSHWRPKGAAPALHRLFCGQQPWHICQPEIAFLKVLALLMDA